MMRDVLQPLVLAVRLAGRFWPQLLFLGTFGYLVHDLLLDAATRAGLQNALAGMVLLSLVVLAKLAIIVMMFSVLRPALPGIRSLAAPAGAAAQAPETDQERRLMAVTAAAILPFFVYYAAWGFLSDTVREYSRLALARVPFGEKANFFDLVQSRWVLVAIVGIWVIRLFAKRMGNRGGVSYWRFLVVACDASWIFIGLYGLSVLKDRMIESLGSGGFLDQSFLLAAPAWAADSFTPAEFARPGLSEQLQRLFFYALLPLIWLVMAAIINGYDVAAKAGGRGDKAQLSTWRKWFGDFIAHFIDDYRSRYAPVWRCLRLTLGASLATLLTLVVAYRLIGWLGAWTWVGLTRLIGGQDLVTWQFLAGPISFFFGSPSDLDGGILLDALRICLLAAVLDYAVSSARRPA
ncbi:hypothetical protein AB4144_06720 [Rhizobiaceae sp. 2RAB30]